MSVRPKLISSAQNPEVKKIAGLKKRRERRKSGLTVVEAGAELRPALAAGARLRTLYYAPDLVDDADREEFLSHAEERSLPVVEVGPEAFAKMAYRESPDGWLATADLPDGDLADIAPGPEPLVLLAEGVEKPGNLGAILRTADGMGADAVIAVDSVVDWGNPNVVRASKGMVFSVPLASAALEETLAWLAERDVRILAATPEGAVDYTAADYSGGVAIAVGAEHSGLTGELAGAASQRIVIPMLGNADSLNVSTSLAIIAYHALWKRQSARA
ncbi:TrmH family RNA methyltransferase [Salininema proteolyticum]|uniref:TrmH family RNA methyltransferase n=1 Tax=Salininema proteolyticum TaxID=1607685 RepID=A0ABV8TUH1_9ACTN